MHLHCAVLSVAWVCERRHSPTGLGLGIRHILETSVVGDSSIVPYTYLLALAYMCIEILKAITLCGHSSPTPTAPSRPI